MFLFSWCASPVSNDLTDDTLEPVVKYNEIQGTKGESPVEGLFDVGPASSTRSGSSRASGSRLQSFLESLNDFEKVESEAISLMTSELGHRSFLVEVNEVIHKKPLCRTGHCQISTGKWHGQTVALKELNIDPANTKRLLDATRDLTQEMHIMSQISHPCLVKLLGANLGTNPFVLTEFMEHRDVETYMRQRREVSGFYKPRFGLAKSWAISTGRALAYLHGLKHPIIHRDVKPLNLFLGRNLEVKLGDFGLCKAMPRRCSTSSSPAPRMTGQVGTWRYMAPEVVRREHYNEKVDIYSFGLILYFIFSGKQPWFAVGDDEQAILKAYIEGKDPRPSLDSSVGTCELRDFLPNFWHRDADQRPSAQECVEKLASMELPSMKDTIQMWTRRLMSRSRAN